MIKNDIITIIEPIECTVIRDIEGEQGNNQKTTYTVYFETKKSFQFIVIGEWEREAFEKALYKLLVLNNHKL